MARVAGSEPHPLPDQADANDKLVQRALMVWTNLFGIVSFELFGQLHKVVGEAPADRDAFLPSPSAAGSRLVLDYHVDGPVR